MAFIKRALLYLATPLRSRKNQVALTTLIVAYLAKAGLSVSEETMMAIVGIGIALILGIAHEDNGAKRTTTTIINQDAGNGKDAGDK